MIEVAKNLKANGLKIFFLSNNLKERTNYYLENFKFISELPEKAYFSWQTGYIKPDERAYNQILNEYNLKPEECLYFDDSDKNVAVAKSLGIQAHKFIDHNQVAEICQIEN